MKVSELILLLQGMDPEAEVMTEGVSVHDSDVWTETLPVVVEERHHEEWVAVPGKKNRLVVNTTVVFTTKKYEG